jgi:hypothetical protein
VARSWPWPAGTSVGTPGGAIRPVTGRERRRYRRSRG